MVLCLMRRLQTSDKINSLVAAACASVWIAMEPTKRKSLIIVLLLSRAFGVLAQMSTNNGSSREIPYFNVIISIICFAQQQWLVLYEADSLNRSQYGFLHKWGNFFENDKIMQKAWHQMANNAIQQGRMFPV